MSMTIELIGILTLVVALLGMYREPEFIVYAFFFATLLGSAAAFVLDSLGGTNISPAHLLLGFLTIKLMSKPAVLQSSIREIAVGRPGFWLLLTTIYAVLSAYFMPRIFAGQTLIFSVREARNAYGTPLEPAMSNVTQSIYLVANFVCFFVLSGYATQRAGRKTLENAALMCVLLNLIFVAIDLATYVTNTTELLAFMRNANYAILTDGIEIAGFKRIIGSFVEASSFGAATLGYFAFTSRLWLLGIRPRLTLVLTFLSLCALVFSTSTTAYVGLALFLFLSYVGTVFRAMLRPMTPQMTLFLIGGPIVLLILAIGIALNDDAWAYIMNLSDTMVLNKMSTDSGVERSTWNRQALQVFIDTYGFGAGNGSLRSSSFPLAVLASIGIFGTTLFSLFFITLFAQRDTGADDWAASANRQAAKSACLAWLITATISGALTDLGLTFFFFAAIACSKPVRVSEPAPSFAGGPRPTLGVWR
jgi:hypothetical protein